MTTPNADIVIGAENVAKRYLVGHISTRRDGHDTLRDAIVRNARNFGRKAMDVVRGRQIIEGDAVEDFWALKDVSFDVKRGEVLGIVGPNGAGKSTLLKILSRITEPTEGRVTISGQVASLLEVGTGFHPELSGRENVFLNGAILGMTRTEIRAQFDEIVAFAGVERFLDTPVKRYSTGMQVRLAFAVAAHLRSEILVVDEVLAVGDGEFQKKCLGKMGDVALSGRTVLLVSHNLGSLRSLCSHGILLSEGRLITAGSISSVLKAYSAKNQLSSRVYPEDSIVRRVAVYQDMDKIVLELEYAELRGKLTIPGFGFIIHDTDGRAILGHNPMLEHRNLNARWPTKGVVRAIVTSPQLLDGAYTVSVFFGDPYSTIFRDPNCLSFSISGSADSIYQLPPEQVGPVYPECRYEFIPLEVRNEAVNASPSDS
ncbi:MAG: polysaccharide ABC transporter ATP-binding protein [Terracidiphilus sp.]